MGSSTSRLVDIEKGNWVMDHSLCIDPALRATQLPLIKNFGKFLKICFRLHYQHGAEYYHYFVTDGTWTIEFGGGDISDNHIMIHSKSQNHFIVAKEFACTPDVKSRMQAVCGARGYSLCLRNCEHAANYIHTGTWYSLQMTGNSSFRKLFIAHMMQQQISLINTAPLELRVDASSDSGPTPRLYQEWKSDHEPHFNCRLQVLTKSDDTAMNIILLGPTGSGKSTLANLLLQQKVCKTMASPLSVTRQMDILSGTFFDILYDNQNKPCQKVRRNLRIIDSIGFCDSTIPADEVLKIVKSYIKSNVLYVDKVIIVCAGRIEQAHADAIKDFMTWLDYPRHNADFVFIYNKAEDLSMGERLQSVGQMCHLLGADPRLSTVCGGKSVPLAFTTGFPPRASLAEVQDDLVKLHDAVFKFRCDKRRMRVDESWCSVL